MFSPHLDGRRVAPDARQSRLSASDDGFGPLEFASHRDPPGQLEIARSLESTEQIQSGKQKIDFARSNFSSLLHYPKREAAERKLPHPKYTFLQATTTSAGLRAIAEPD